jgi:hypothetical protein
MEWKTDWLYRLVFERVRDVWTEGHAYSEGYNEHTWAAVYLASNLVRTRFDTVNVSA